MLYKRLQLGNSAEFIREEVCALATVIRVADTDEWLRQQVLSLVRRHGISQKVLAGKMGMTGSTLSRWLHRKPGVRPPSVTALDGFYAYREELRRAVSDDLLDPKQQATPKAPPPALGEAQAPRKTRRSRR